MVIYGAIEPNMYIYVNWDRGKHVDGYVNQLKTSPEDRIKYEWVNRLQKQVWMMVNKVKEMVTVKWFAKINCWREIDIRFNVIMSWSWVLELWIGINSLDVLK